LENLEMSFWRSKNVLLTGHTGFKGAWLSHWLLAKGAVVTGLSLAPDAEHLLFGQLGLEQRMDHHILDIRNAEALRVAVTKALPDVVFHLAAQPLVRQSYRDPLDTWTSNVMGTANLLDALRTVEKKTSVVFVTTDKVYENANWVYGYRESDPLGGHDPYSSSKSASEIAVQSWRKSFFEKSGLVRVATVRAGNVIGGGDWNSDRIIPDIMRAARNNKVLDIRSPNATRPWQHVLEPLHGYIMLAERLHDDAVDPRFASAFNFGPHAESERRVSDLLKECQRYCQVQWNDASNPDQPHEAERLALNIDKALNLLGWSPVWNFETAVKRTVHWYAIEASASDKEIRAQTATDIAAFEAELGQERL
jgi:CDP-glucose 4,6-dehydratase